MAGPIQSIATILLSLSLFISCRESAGFFYKREKLVPFAELNDRQINEQSGITPSALTAELFWVFNDSGDDARIFPIKVTQNSATRFFPSPSSGIAIDGAVNVDWEDICQGADSTLWISDLGNNANDRRDLTLYQIKEPQQPFPSSVAVIKKLQVYYPDQTEFPPEKNNFDSEALFYQDQYLYILTKHRADSNTTLYRVRTETTDNPARLEKTTTFPIGDRVTAADLSPDGKKLAVLTYSAIWVFEQKTGNGDFLNSPVRRLGIFAGQCEAITFESPETLILSNEEGQFFRISVDSLLPLSN